MGCPVNKVAKKAGAGASLLKDPQNVYNITQLLKLRGTKIRRVVLRHLHAERLSIPRISDAGGLNIVIAGVSTFLKEKYLKF